MNVLKKALKVLGLDLGTTASASSGVNEAGESRPVRQRDGSFWIPSVLHRKDGKTTVGTEAERMLVLEPENGIRHPKREMSVVNPDGSAPVMHVDTDGTKTTAVDACADILRVLRENAMAVANDDIDFVAITVPACANEAQRQRTIKAGQMAGFTDVHIAEEPIAAVLGAGLAADLGPGERLMVVDIGGGTSDVAIVTSDERGNLTVVGTNGRDNVAGNELDAVVLNMLEEHLRSEGVSQDVLGDPSMRHHIVGESRRAKHELSTAETAIVALFIDGRKIRFDITRDEFEASAASVTEQIIDVVDEALSANGLKPGDISVVLPVGGSSRVPAIRKALERRFADVRTCEEPDLVVSMGAALIAAKMIEAEGQEVRTLAGERVAALPPGTFTLCSSFDLGCMAYDRGTGEPEFIVMIEKNTSLPAEHTQAFALREKGQDGAEIRILQGNKGQHPDECLEIDTLHLMGLPAEDGTGKARIRVHYVYRSDGLVCVTATDTDSGITETTNIERYLKGA